MLDVVAPVLQVNVPSQPVAVKVALSPSQQTVLSVVTIGAFGVDFVVITTGEEAGLTPQLLLQVAV
jgi:hypothetical protein